MIIAAILAGGRGLRLGSKIPKQLLPLGNKQVIQWSVDTFHSSHLIDEIIIVSEKSYMESIRAVFNQQKYPKIAAFIEGGAERVDSSARAIFHKEYSPDDIFLIHDAARPFITEGIISELVKAVEKYGAAGIYIPAKDTMAIVKDNLVESIPDRTALFYAQTPQGFRYSVIADSHKNHQIRRFNGITDDISLVKAGGYEAGVVNGSDMNFKITTESDYILAGCMVEKGIVKA